MSAKSIKKLIRNPLAASPPHTAIGPRLTVAHIKSLGGYASTVKAAGLLIALLLLQSAPTKAQARKKRVPPGGRVAVVVDERLAALRSAPDLRAKLVERLGRGHLVSIRGQKATPEGLKFYKVAISRKIYGWLQSNAVVVPWRVGDDRRLVTLIENSDEFDRIVRAKTFLDVFPRSPLVPKVLALYASEADDIAEKLSQTAQRRFTRNELPADGAPEFSYYLNYSGLDRYNREGITFEFDRATKKFSYDGVAWRELIKRYPNSPEAADARKHLEGLSSRQKP